MNVINYLVYYKEIIKNYCIRKWNDIIDYELVNGESNVVMPPYYVPFR